MENKAKNRLLSHTVLLGACTLAAKLPAFFLVPLYTACLSPAEYGTVDVLLESAALLIPFASLCAPEALFRFVAGGEERATALRAGVRLLLCGILLLALSMPICALSRVLRPHLALLFFYVVAAVGHGFLAQYLRALGYYGAFAMQQVLCAGVAALLSVFFLYILRAGVAGYLFSVILSDLFCFVVVGAFLFKRHFLGMGERKKGIVPRMARFALPLVPTTALWWLGGVVDRYVILFFAGSSAIGLYAVAGKLPSLLSFALSAFLTAWHFAALRTSPEARAALFSRCWRYLLPLLTLACGGLVLLAPLAVRLVLPPEYHAARYLVPLLSLAALFSAFSAFWGSQYTLSLHSTASLITAVFGIACHVALDLLLVPRFGVMGAVAATLAGHLVSFLARALDCRRRYGVRVSVDFLLPALLLLGGALAATAGQYPLAALAVALSICPLLRPCLELVGLLLFKMREFSQKILTFSRKKF